MALIGNFQRMLSEHSSCNRRISRHVGHVHFLSVRHTCVANIRYPFAEHSSCIRWEIIHCTFAKRSLSSINESIHRNLVCPVTAVTS